MRRNLDSAIIPSLREDPVKLEKFIEKNSLKKRKSRDSDFGSRGDEASELAVFEGLVDFCKRRMIDNHGRTKIASLGGGELEAVIKLVDTLSAEAKRLGIKPDISVEEYALTDLIAKENPRYQSGDKLLENGTLNLHTGPLEVRKLTDAAQADVVVSVLGPLVHWDRELGGDEILNQLILKVCRCLSEGGQAFLHTQLKKYRNEDKVATDNRKKKFVDQLGLDLGSEFKAEVIERNNLWKSREFLYLHISRERSQPERTVST